ncbi:helix-turn-helix domain-containing protein [Brasilonema sp. UFV-L1]|uniref:helix-turn-helix domain-containing protein n=1 Tax=Brasilonema sp. UFV-L1 TaxID=2234130 RepID=UPI001B7CFBEC|nr:helix-turn-helix domain-containing protein [Brasilonema sp. UFV-L1]
MTHKLTLMTDDSGSSTIQRRQERLTHLIEQLLEDGWTQTALAQKVGVDFSTVYRWLKGKSIPETDSKNFQKLANLSGGDSKTLQLYLDGEISLSAYRQGLEIKLVDQEKISKTSTSEMIKKEVLAKIYSLDPADIAEVISRSVTFLAKRA